MTRALWVVACLVCASAVAGDWPQWRGPALTMAVDGDGAFTDGEFALEVAWKRPLGPGYSSFSVVGGRAVTMFSDAGDDVLVALDAATGRELWRYRIGETYAGHSSSESGPRGTPAIAGDAVYGLGPHGHLFAVRLSDGGEIWRRDLVEELGAEPPEYGFSTPPLLVDGVLVVETGAPEGGAVSGFDPASGERLWSAVSDTVGHQSPLPVTLGGEPQVLVVTARYVQGVEARTGRVLWQHLHNETPRSEGGWSQPLLVDGDKILLSYWDDSALYQVRREDGEGDGYVVRELWRTRDLKLHTLMPVYHRGYLYGYNQRFLSCVDPATGRAVWKSRPPGYGGMALIDGHLVILGPRGDLVVVEATPEGYREIRRLKLFERHSLAPVSYAGGRLYARDMAEAAAVAVVRAPAAKRAGEPAAPEPGGELAAFLERLERAPDKARAVADFLAGRELPLVENDGTVHFLYRGSGDIGLVGNMLDVGDQVSLTNVPGAGFSYLSRRLEPGGVWEYAFVVDFEELVLDPGNPRRAETPDGPRSLVATPGWQEPEYRAASVGGPRGRLERLVLPGDAERPVQVYLPAGYDEERAYPLLVVHHGGQALEYGEMARVLDRLVGQSVEALVVAFVSPRSRSEYSGYRAESYAAMITGELLPELRWRYRLLPGRENVATLGAAEAATAAADLATRHPEVFGKVALQSYTDLDQGDEIRRRLRREGLPPALWYVEWRRRDLKSEPGLDQARWWTRDATAHSRSLVELLAAGGHDVHRHELPGGPGWSSWRARTGEILETLFPRSQASESGRSER